MTAKTCVQCGGTFTPARRNRMTCSDACRREHDNAVKRAYDATPARVKARRDREQAARAARLQKPKPAPKQRGQQSMECAHCRVTFKAKTAGKVYCSRDCINQAAAARKLNRAPIFLECVRCSKPLEKPKRGHRFCGSSCRKANHMDKIRAESVDLDATGEIVVAELEEAPRRLAVAKLFDRFEETQFFDHFTPAQWMNPTDRRAGR